MGGLAVICFDKVGATPMRMLLALLLSFICLSAADDGTYCFNGCSGHGRCESYACICDAGYHGEDCRTTFSEVLEGDSMLPILSVGSFNITSSNFSKVAKANPYMLIGVSSPDCHKCIQYETAYSKLLQYLDEVDVPFGRVNGATQRKFIKKHSITSFPALLFSRKGKVSFLDIPHTFERMRALVDKLTSPAMPLISTQEDLTEFFVPSSSRITPFATSVLGVFSDLSADEDEVEDVEEAAKGLWEVEGVYFAAISGIY